MRAALGLWWRLRRAEAASPADARSLDLLAVLAYAVASGALLITAGGLHAFWTRHAGTPTDTSAFYVVLALTAAALLVVPILTLGGVASRLCLGRRNARLASLRLCGATSGQVGAMVLAESAHQAVLGALAGVGLYAAAIPCLSVVSFDRRPLAAAELWLGPALVFAVIAGVVLLALLSGLSSLGAVVVGPLGVAQRTTPGRLRAWRVAIGAGLLLLWIFGAQTLGQIGTAAVLAVLAAVVAAVNLAGPVFVQGAGRIYARTARRAPGLIAARRIVDDPRATWRAVSSLGLAICLAALSSISGAEANEPDGATLAADMGTGALIALAIVTAVAATSTGVVQAARVIDQRNAYRDLALAGTPLSVLHRARLAEVGVPLLVTLALGSILPVLILVPMSSLLGPGVIVRVLIAIAASVAVMLASVQASRGLVTRYALAA